MYGYFMMGNRLRSVTKRDQGGVGGGEYRAEESQSEPLRVLSNEERL